MSWKVHVQPMIPLGFLGYRLFIARDNGGETIDIVQPFTLKTINRYESISEKEALLSDEWMDGHGTDVRGLLQAMSDAAWELGIKPKQIENNANELKAIRDHLADMRTLAIQRAPEFNK